MSHRIAYVSATEKELEPLVQYLQVNAEQHSFQTFQLHGLLIDILYTGIGMLQSTYNLMDYICHRHPNGWIQAGVGGAFDPLLPVGSVYLITSEMQAGYGAEDQDGRILDPFALGWNDPDGFPFVNGRLECPYETVLPIDQASGMTTYHAHGEKDRISWLRRQAHGQIENMEGAPFFFISLTRKIPFLSLRSISNMVEPRDTSKWKMDQAIQNLSRVLIEQLEAAQFNPDKLFRLRSG